MYLKSKIKIGRMKFCSGDRTLCVAMENFVFSLSIGLNQNILEYNSSNIKYSNI